MSQPRVIGDPRLAAAAERAFNKLIAALPVTLRAQAASMRQRLHVDVTGWWGVPHEVAALPIVQDAVARDRKLSFQYRRTSGERAERKVDPLGLVAKGTTWYLVANTPNGLRTYRVSRIEEAVLLDAPSVRPPDFDLTRYEATLRLTPDAAAKLKTWHICSPAQAAVPAEPDGSFVVRVRFEDEEQALFVVLGFGSRAAVIEPLSLRARVGAEISAMVKEATRSSRASDRESGDSAAVPVPS
jgi:predicted DNA-binding transcriptional regulator YafY